MYALFPSVVRDYLEERKQRRERTDNYAIERIN